MGDSVLVLRNVLIIVGVFIAECSAGNKWQKVVTPEKSIECYDCNSEYDPRCGMPFDNYTIGVVNCSEKRRLEHMKEAAPVLCRKTIQKVQGKTRVIRGCGYITDIDHDDKSCFMRTGTHDVHVTFCSCTTSLCNTGHTIHPPVALMMVIAVALTAITKMRVA